MANENKKKSRKKHSWWKWVLGIVVAFLVIDVAIAAKLYYDAKKSVSTTYKTVKYNDKRQGKVNMTKGQPFSVLLLGSDTGEYGRSYQGRSDTIMVAAVTTKGTKLVNLLPPAYAI